MSPWNKGKLMHLVCCIKQVPNTAEVKIDPETNTLIRAGVESIANPYDMVALEAARAIKDRHGGKVIAISVSYEGCLECGSCRIGCPHLNIEWRFPTGGYGISHRFG